MPKRIALFLAAMLLAASCGGPAREAGEPGGAVASLNEIRGSWDVERFDGYEPVRLAESGLRHAWVEIGPRGLSYRLECNGSGHEARLDGAGILRDESEGPRISTLMACEPETDARENAFFGFFAAEPLVEWAKGGRLRMRSGRTELILQRPEARRLAFLPDARELAGRWVPQSAYRLEGEGGHSGWGFRDREILAIAGDRLTWSGCGGAAFVFRYAAGGRLVTEEEGDARCTGNAEGLLLRILRDDPLTERTEGGGIALSAGDLVVALHREEE